MSHLPDGFPDPDEEVTVTRVIVYTATRERMRQQLALSLADGRHGVETPAARGWGIVVEVDTTDCPGDLLDIVMGPMGVAT